MRLRTLPLSLAGIIMGIFLAVSDGQCNPRTILFLVLTTISLQVLSNLSNELGDTLHGTDSAEQRQGMHYSLMDGGMTIGDIRKLIAGSVVASIIFGTIMVWCSFGTVADWYPAAFLILGAFAVWAAMHYTLGKHPYGYIALGDLFVFIFFGVATVLGGYLLCAHTVSSWSVLLPTAAIGFFSVGVLNVNNIRDMKTDASTRVTVAIMFGNNGSRIYHTVLICFGWISMLTFTILRLLNGSGSLWQFLYLLTLPLFIMHLKGVWTRHDRELDAMLPMLVMSSFAFSLLSGIGLLLNI